MASRLETSKFTVWRDVSWNDGISLPLFAFRNVILPFPQSQSIFLKEAETTTIDQLNSFSKDCFRYVQRTKPKLWQSRFITQYLVILCVVGEGFEPEVIEHVRQGVLPRSFTSEMPFPVLIAKSSGEIHYFEDMGWYGIAVFVIAKLIVRKLLIPAWRSG